MRAGLFVTTRFGVRFPVCFAIRLATFVAVCFAGFFPAFLVGRAAFARFMDCAGLRAGWPGGFLAGFLADFVADFFADFFAAIGSSGSGG